MKGKFRKCINLYGRQIQEQLLVAQDTALSSYWDPGILTKISLAQTYPIFSNLPSRTVGRTLFLRLFLNVPLHRLLLTTLYFLLQFNTFLSDHPIALPGQNLDCFRNFDEVIRLKYRRLNI